MAQKVSDVMTSEPVTVDGDTPVLDVARFMRDRDIGDVLVVDDDKLCGVITDRDIVVRALAETADLATLTVGSICSAELTTVKADDDVERAVSLMRERALRRLPVVDGDRPIGIVSIGDLAIERDSESALANVSASPPNT